jgi:hypothetical protein
MTALSISQPMPRTHKQMILEHIHVVVMHMLCTAEINMTNSVKPSNIDMLLSDAAWANHSTYHTVLKASPGAAIFGQDMLFDIPFIADWKIMEIKGKN